MFQCTRDIALSAVKCQLTLVNRDNIVVLTRSAAEHIDQVNGLLTLSRDAGVTIKLGNCNPFPETIDYLGYVIRARHMKIASHTTDGIINLKAARIGISLRSFLGFCNLSRQFLANFAKIASPSNDKLQNDQPFNFELNRKELKAMKSVQRIWPFRPYWCTRTTVGE